MSEPTKARRPVAMGLYRCLDCARVYAEPPPGWACLFCDGPVSQNMGTIRVPGTPAALTDEEPKDGR